VTEGSGFGITQSCDNKTAAAKALAIMTGSKAAKQLATEGRSLAARTAQQQYWFDHVDAESAAALKYAIAHAQPQRKTKNWTSVIDMYTQYGTGVINGTTSVTAFMNQVQSKVGQ
jgi:multiple sugar transport system substrate-binding protein